MFWSLCVFECVCEHVPMSEPALVSALVHWALRRGEDHPEEGHSCGQPCPGSFKKPFEKACKDYESKLTKIEKEKCELAKQHGMVQSEVSWGEIAEEMEKECRTFQLNMCEYLIKVNEIKTKKGIDLLQNHIKHCSSHRALLLFLFCQDPGNKRAGYNMHQLQGNKQYGTDKSGTLFKKSDGLRKVWQKRKCTISNGYLTISHSMVGTLNCPPAKLNLLTCQVKPNMNDKKKKYALIWFPVTTFCPCSWVSVLSNSKEEALNMAFSKAQGGGKSSQEELTRAIIKEVRGMPGNRECCDCSAPDPTWLSINLGILICIECSGIHREMGVHLSRTQSLSLDKLATSELLLARNIGNSGFNNILEANLPSFSLKPTVHSDMAFQKNFIISKYVRKKYAKRSPAAQCSSLPEAVKDKDIFSLLQAYAENMDLSKPVLAPLQECGETILHLAVLLSDCTSLHIVDFSWVLTLSTLCCSGSLAKRMAEGNTPLHYYCFHNKPECVKLLLKAKANITITNEAGETALDVARRMKHPLCEELLLQARAISSPPHVHVECEWWLGQDDMYESDEDLDEKVSNFSSQHFCCDFPGIDISLLSAGNTTKIPIRLHCLLREAWFMYLGCWQVRVQFGHRQGCGVHTGPASLCSRGPPPSPRGHCAEADATAHAAVLGQKSRCLWKDAPAEGGVLWIPVPPKLPAGDLLCVMKLRRPDDALSCLQNRLLLCRVCTLYDCNGDWEDELTFRACEIIVVSEKEDSNWWGVNLHMVTGTGMCMITLHPSLASVP
uniref:Arf-GAP domain-containing protein n=1 Tax=Aquila chrysaetos chrysaetos TaxID=223781 RepID=A0A663E1B0_AQUCH